METLAVAPNAVAGSTASTHSAETPTDRATYLWHRLPMALDCRREGRSRGQRTPLRGGKITNWCESIGRRSCTTTPEMSTGRLRATAIEADRLANYLAGRALGGPSPALRDLARGAARRRARVSGDGGQRRRPCPLQRVRHCDSRARGAGRAELARLHLGRPRARHARDDSPADPGHHARRRAPPLLLGARGGALLLRRWRSDRVHAGGPRDHARRDIRGGRH